MIDLSQTKVTLDVKVIAKTYELRFLRGNKLNVLQCSDEVLPNIIHQIITDGFTLTKVSLV